MLAKLFPMLAVLAVGVNGLKVVSQSSYTTSEEISSYPDAVFTVQMKLDIQAADLFAFVDDVVVPVSYEGENYQVSWHLPYSKAYKGDHIVSLYDNVGFERMQKYLEGEGAKPEAILTLPVYYRNASKISHSISVSLLAIGASIFGFFKAHRVKTNRVE
eukprot:CFRG0428T1